MDRLMNAAVRFAWVGFCAAVLVWTGCASPDHSKPETTEFNGAPDSTTVVLSKFYNSQNYRTWLGRLAHSEGLGPLRFIQAYGADSAVFEQEILRAAAVVLTGGEDIHPARYGQAEDTIRCGRIDVERDRVEHLLLDRVMELGLPCLGVCRGLQVMNVHGGGSLHPHLPDAGYDGHRGGFSCQTLDTSHEGRITQPWWSGPVEFSQGEAGTFVSHHHQGIDRLSNQYLAWAEGPEGLTEGIRHKDTLKVPFLVGVQWHPERSRSGELLSDGLGLALLKAASP